MQATMNSTPVVDYVLTKKDEDTLRTFRTLLKLDGKAEFSSDDFRRYGLDRFIKDTQHGIGYFFAKIKHNKLAQEVGHKRSDLASNHGRQIRTYRWVKD